MRTSHTLLLLIALGLSFTLYSCHSQQDRLTIEREKLVSILADFHMAEEMLGKFRQQEKDSVRRRFMYDISVIHQVDTAEIFMNIELLQGDSKQGLEIYSDVYEKLTDYAESDKKKQNQATHESSILKKSSSDSIISTPLKKK